MTQKAVMTEASNPGNTILIRVQWIKVRLLTRESVPARHSPQPKGLDQQACIDLSSLVAGFTFIRTAWASRHMHVQLCNPNMPLPLSPSL